MNDLWVRGRESERHENDEVLESEHDEEDKIPVWSVRTAQGKCPHEL